MKKRFKFFLIFSLVLQTVSTAIVPFRSKNGAFQDIGPYEDAGKLAVFSSVGNMLMATEEKNYRSCSGALIGKFGDFGIFLTARHCLKYNDIKTTSKCTNASVSFDHEPAWDNAKTRSPVIAQIPFEKFGTEQEIPDLGIAIVHLKESDKKITPAKINFGAEISNKSNHSVYVVGYGNTELNDTPKGKTPIKRRAMSQRTRAKPISSRSALPNDMQDVLITEGKDEKNYHNLNIPWGYSASVGDSGGPMFEAISNSIIGTVQSGNFGKAETYYEFLRLYKNWLENKVLSDPIKMLSYTSRKSGNWKDVQIWDQEKEPELIQLPHINAAPLVNINSHSVEITEPTAVHQVSVGGKEGALKINNTRATFDVLSCNAGARIDASKGSLRTDALEVNSGEVFFSGGMLIGHKMSIGKGVSLDITENGAKNRKIEMRNNSVLSLEGELKTDSLTMLNGSRVFLNGVIETISGLTQIGGGLYIQGGASIKGGYSLSTNGSLIFEAKKALESTPMLTLAPQEGEVVNLNLENIVVDLSGAARNERLILTQWENEDRVKKFGQHLSYRGANKNESVKFSTDRNIITVLVSAGPYPTTEDEDVPPKLPIGN